MFYQILDNNDRENTLFIIRKQPEDWNIQKGFSAMHNAAANLRNVISVLSEQMFYINDVYGTKSFKVIIED